MATNLQTDLSGPTAPAVSGDTLNSPEGPGVSTGEVWGLGVSSSRRSCRISLTVSRIIARRLTGSGAMSSAEFLDRFGEDGSSDPPSAIWRVVVDVRDRDATGYKKMVALLLARVQNCNYYPRACALDHTLRAPLWHGTLWDTPMMLTSSNFT